LRALQSFSHRYPILGGAYYLAGRAASDVKRRLNEQQAPDGLARRVAIATYEAEMNICIHAIAGEVVVVMEGERVEVSANDRGPGIPDVERALTPGFSTASAKARAMGFGAGLGFANMQRCADDFGISSQVGCGTRVAMAFAPRPDEDEKGDGDAAR
jgi:anti-sigma regulatory factor (Ser/Thr protein kinase)